MDNTTPTDNTVLSARTLAFMQANGMSLHSTYHGPQHRFVFKDATEKYGIARPDRKCKGGLRIAADRFDNVDAAMDRLKNPLLAPSSGPNASEPDAIGQSG